MTQLFVEFVRLLTNVLIEIREVRTIQKEQEADIMALEEITQKLEEDVANVAAKDAAQDKAIAELKAIIEELKGLIVTPEQLARLEKVDADLDVLTAPAPEPPVEPVAAKTK
jgi:archaellum component FlaC